MRAPRLRSSIVVPLLAGLAVAAVTLRASGDEIEGHTVIALADIQNPNPAGWEGKKVCVDAKFSKVFGDNLKVELVEDDRIKIDQQSQLYLALSNYKTVDGKPLEKEKGKPKSNVRIFGTCGKDEAGNLVLIAERVDKLEDEAPAFMAKIEAVLKKPQGQQTADDFYKISTEARARMKIYNVDLKEVVKRADGEGIRVELRLRKTGDSKAAIGLGKRMLDLTGEADEAIKLWGEVALDEKAGEAERREAQELLRKNYAYLWRGEYVSYTRFKHAVGFVARKGQWVRRERAEFEDAIEKELKNTALLIVPIAPKTLQEKGQVTRGENKEQVIGTKDFGFPTHVDRKVTQDLKSGKPITWDQWVYENGPRVYFINGLCCELVARGVPWPEK